MEVKPEVIKENLELLLKDILSLIFFYNAPYIEVEILNHRDLSKRIPNYQNLKRLFLYQEGKKIFIYEMKRKNTFVIIEIFSERIKNYPLPEELLTFTDFLVKSIVEKFLYEEIELNSFVFSDKEEILRNISKRYVSYLFRWLGYEYTPSEKILLLSHFVILETYEKKSVKSNLVFISPDDKVDMDISFSNNIDLDRKNFRVIRKIFEIVSKSNSNLVVIARGNSIIGISKISNMQGKKNVVFSFRDGFLEVFVGYPILGKSGMLKDIFVELNGVKFLPIIRFRNGFPEVHRQFFDKGEIRSIIKKVFKNIDLEKTDKVVKLVKECSKQSHGMIVIVTTTALAKSESERLSNKIFKLEPFSLFDDNGDVKKDVLSAITSIDGAIIVDTDGMCYGIGIILDGDVSSVENPSRGARYNSSLRYIESRNNNAIAIVVSDDGMTDIISIENITDKKIENMIESLINENIIIL